MKKAKFQVGDRIKNVAEGSPMFGEIGLIKKVHEPKGDIKEWAYKVEYPNDVVGDCFEIVLKKIEGGYSMDRILEYLAGKECLTCGNSLDGVYPEMYDHDGGVLVRGKISRQWIYKVCPHCSYQNSYKKLMTSLKWWEKRIIAHEQRVEAGDYGEVLKKWKQNSGWMDSVQTSHYIVFDGATTPQHIYVCESGVFEVGESGGAGSITKKERELVG